jgi:hypothetical protein
MIRLGRGGWEVARRRSRSKVGIRVSLRLPRALARACPSHLRSKISPRPFRCGKSRNMLNFSRLCIRRKCRSTGREMAICPSFSGRVKWFATLFPSMADYEEPGYHIGHLTPAPDAMGNPSYTFPNMTQQSPHLLAALSPESPNLPHPGFFGHHNISRASTLPTEDTHVPLLHLNSLFVISNNRMCTEWALLRLSL